ncbi:MAG TPA: GNAT family N-acetyltransferase [Ottowia sp.]|mgnify:CR=1 FL=1|uniref:GNAT family N-acetyltransferase n=1 Tax=Ottowia sp. TaxID=1898956 RepID=UPI002D130D68|nr:GNAT family N-acetyltransferase [Ottowia sp.]HMN20940.1 GNAT family N-acetyltransferase [Ottowia sp.]
MTEAPRTYPRHVDCGAAAVAIDRMTPADQGDLVRFIAALPPEDLLFVPRDITHPKVIDAWMQALQTGHIASLTARVDGVLVGCTSIYTDRMSWSRHVGELRVLVAAGTRGQGIGRALIQECFLQALELGLAKLVAHMTTNQARAIAVFEDLGFRPEALLSGHVADRAGALHDLVILSHDVRAVAARHAAYGLGDSVAAG